jgi:hypothetical protein
MTKQGDRNHFGFIAALVTLVSVLAFAASMLAGADTGSYISSLGISWGFVPMACAFAALAGRRARAAAYTAIAFAALYGVFIAAVYYAQITTVGSGVLSDEASALLDYSQFGLFFNYDLLGYAFMALSTFFLSYTLAPRDKGDRALKWLLRIHGVFAVTCVVLPTLGLFRPGMAGGDLIGVLVLEVWCCYFAPVCVLACRYFRRVAHSVPEE